MTDPRTTPDPSQVVMQDPAQITKPVTDLTRGIDGPRDRQLLFGAAVTVLNRTADHALVQADWDGYCGWVPRDALGPSSDRTHIVTARATHVYSAPDIKSREITALSFGSALSVTEETALFLRTKQGFVPRQHVHPASTIATDPAAIAKIFLGTPYLWGGNSAFGIDCSGLVQAACRACAIPCPGDSDLQAHALGSDLPGAAPLQRNDVVFWKGHVALVVDPDTLIHANAGHMATVLEPISDAFARIEAQGDGTPTGYRRLL